MSWRFRRSYRTGPFRWTWSKRGIGWNWKLPGFRVGISPTGQKYISFGIPGTGFYYIKYFNKIRGISITRFMLNVFRGIKKLFPNSWGSFTVMIIICVFLAACYQELRKSFVYSTPPAAASYHQPKHIAKSAPVASPVKISEEIPQAISEDSSKVAIQEEKKTDAVVQKSIVHEAAPEPTYNKQPAITANYFTVGSTSDEVLNIQGTPTSMYGNTYSYGFSSVTFYHGRVTSYYNSGNLKIRLRPSTSTFSNSIYFTLGSSVDEVLSVQGTPSSMHGNTYSYGFSTVTFHQGSVSNYYNSGNLRIKIFP